MRAVKTKVNNLFFFTTDMIDEITNYNMPHHSCSSTQTNRMLNLPIQIFFIEGQSLHFT
jgi:hypothetical protein